MFILFISLFYCRVGPTTIREISAVFTGFPKIRHLQKYDCLPYLDQKQEVVIAISRSVQPTSSFSTETKNGAKHLHRYLGR
ncbi:unnamed protein product [Callosobruchus maculatus]|uniref:Uncharacterized protein n=1 Tax=Callosobruchus maculatus TaxID=64391 RepID=A0A653D338_CALMS|nr:unnamed protein product [Callosobruchus maculatus]